VTRPVRWLVTGADGRLGRSLVAALRRREDVTVTAASRSVLDVTDRAAVASLVPGHDIVVNTAAWTDVDGAEAAESAAAAVNGDAVHRLAGACALTSAWLIQISTDYVFSGRSKVPYAEYAAPDPINAYGRSKLAGERAVAAELPDRGLVVRTAWLYGEHDGSFLDTALRRAHQGKPVRVVNDQRGQPTHVDALTRQVVALATAALRGAAGPGIYHGTSTGHASRYELALAAVRLVGLDPGRVTPITTSEFRSAAARPSYTVLQHSRWRLCGIPDQPHWHEQLEAFLRSGYLLRPA
jgi:dTDP-4-dehydrorhamnose reductase